MVSFVNSFQKKAIGHIYKVIVHISLAGTVRGTTRIVRIRIIRIIGNTCQFKEIGPACDRDRGVKAASVIGQIGRSVILGITLRAVGIRDIICIGLGLTQEGNVVAGPMFGSESL